MLHGFSDGEVLLMTPSSLPALQVRTAFKQVKGMPKTQPEPCLLKTYLENSDSFFHVKISRLVLKVVYFYLYNTGVLSQRQ